MRAYSILAALAISSSLLTLTACERDDGNLLKRAPGQYDGFIIKKATPHADQVMANGKITLTGPAQLQIQLSSSDGKTNWDFTLHAKSTKLIQLEAPGIFESAPSLEKDSNTCFSAPVKGGVTPLRLCYDGNELLIDQTLDRDHEVIFVLDRHNDKDHPVFEQARTYSVPELLQLGKNKSFTSQVQFENARLGHLNSTEAHLNLLPHLSYASISTAVISVITGQWAGLLSVVGDLAPFLIPSNWVAADTAKWQSQADYYTWLLMKADSANIAEGLGYVILRDKASLAALQAYEKPLTEMRDIIHEKEVLGLVPHGSTDSLNNMLSSLQVTNTQLQKVINEENRGLALAIGLVNPDGVADIAEVTDLSIDNPEDLDVTNLQNLAIDRSMEMRQLDSLIHVAKDASLNRWFSWITPSTATSIGFGLPASIQAGKIPVEELMIQRRELEALLSQKVENAADEVRASLQSYALAKTNAKVLDDRLNTLRDGLMSGLGVSVTDLQVALGDKMKGDTDLLNAKYTYFTAVGKINRLLLTGPYLDIMTRVGDNVNAPRP